MLILDYVLCYGVDTVGVADRARGILTRCVPKKAARDELTRPSGNCCYIMSGVWVIRLLAWQ